MPPLFAEASDREAKRDEDAHVAQLEYEHDRNARQIAFLEERQGRIENELEAIRARREKRERVADIRDGVRSLGEDAPPTGPIPRRSKDAAVDETRLRDAVVRFRRFTLAELAAALKVKPGTVRKQVERMVGDGWLTDTGERFQRQPVYEWVKPDEPGQAFRSQQAQAAPPPPERVSVPVEGIGGSLLAGLKKDVRRVAREAMREGWELRRTGSDHYELFRQGYRSVVFSGTPSEDSHQARRVRFALRRSKGEGAAQRGAPVAHTGRAMGPSGKPGRDKKNAEKGFRVKRERQGT